MATGGNATGAIGAIIGQQSEVKGRRSGTLVRSGGSVAWAETGSNPGYRRLRKREGLSYTGLHKREVRNHREWALRGWTSVGALGQKCSSGVRDSAQGI